MAPEERKSVEKINSKNNVQFQIGGLFKLKKVADYLKLVDTKVGLIFREPVPGLNTKKILSADVAALSDTGTHLILKNVCIKRFFFFSKHFDKSVVPIHTILTVRILKK